MTGTAGIVAETLVAVGNDIAELFAGERARACLMASLAVALAVLAALWVGLGSAWWAGISAFVSLQASAPASLRRGVLRIAGTAVGALAAALLSPWLVDDAVALSVVLLAVGTLGTLGFLVSRYGYAWLLGAITVGMVLLAALADPPSAPAVAATRTVEVTLGTAAAILVAFLLAPPPGEAPPAPPPPGWHDLTGAQWPAVRHALRAGVGVMLIPLVWRWLALPSLAQAAVTAVAVMAVPALSHDPAADRQALLRRAVHRLVGCAFGGGLGLLCLAASPESLPSWLALLIAGIWVAAHLQGSRRGVGYVGMQAAVVLILTLVQGAGPPDSILPGLDRLAGIAGGLAILLAVSLAAMLLRGLAAPEARP